MNKQAVYDQVKTHLLSQLQRAWTNNQTCKYRITRQRIKYDNDLRQVGTEAVTLKCAIGCLIPDELYDANMEDQAVANLLGRFIDLREHLGVKTSEDVDFLADLQQIHDSTCPGYWEQDLVEFACHRGLKP